MPTTLMYDETRRPPQNIGTGTSIENDIVHEIPIPLCHPIVQEMPLLRTVISREGTLFDLHTLPLLCNIKYVNLKLSFVVL
jgi:hypothetical protein